MPHTRHRPCRLVIKKSKRNFAKNLEIHFKLLYFVPSLTPKNAKNGKFDHLRSIGNVGRSGRTLCPCNDCPKL